MAKTSAHFNRLKEGYWTKTLSDGAHTCTYGMGRISQTPDAGSPDTKYFFGNALGAVRQLTSQTSAVTYAVSYSPYGEVSQAGRMYPATSCGEISVGGLSAHEKKSARSLMVCFLPLECGYWQVSQFEN